jgi:hypothetical protein
MNSVEQQIAAENVRVRPKSQAWEIGPNKFVFRSVKKIL